MFGDQYLYTWWFLGFYSHRLQELWQHLCRRIILGRRECRTPQIALYCLRLIKPSVESCCPFEHRVDFIMLACVDRWTQRRGRRLRLTLMLDCHVPALRLLYRWVYFLRLVWFCLKFESCSLKLVLCLSLRWSQDKKSTIRPIFWVSTVGKSRLADVFQSDLSWGFADNLVGS